MTASGPTIVIPAPSAAAASAPGRGGRLAWAARDAGLLARRDLSHGVREPQRGLWGLLFPVVFVLLFAYVLGSPTAASTTTPGRWPSTPSGLQRAGRRWQRRADVGVAPAG